MSSDLGAYEGAVRARLERLARERIEERIAEGDHTVWSESPEEITNRLGWLRAHTAMRGRLGEIRAFAEAVGSDGFGHVLLLGMGGSSLCAEVLAQAFRGGPLSLEVLDSTHPDAVLAVAERIDSARTLFLVSTKSGGTVETLSLFRFFHERVSDVVGAGEAGGRFAAITDPGSPLVELAQRSGFRAVFLNDPEIGGRYSVLSCFGLVPAALVGAELEALLDGAAAVAGERADGVSPGARLGATLGELCLAGRDKLTLVLSPAIESLGAWIEQLVAESTGKDGRGIVPVVGEPLGGPELYGDDRVFVELTLAEDDEGPAASPALLGELAAAGHPVIRLRLDGRGALGGEFYRWEMATAVAGHVLGVNPFDQPNVESAKRLARRMLDEYAARGELPSPSATLRREGLAVYANDAAPAPPAATGPSAGAGGGADAELEGIVRAYFADARPGSYVALTAFVDSDAATGAALEELRLLLRDRLRLATTLGYGPRFLHSTGQLHKGDGGGGLILQLTSTPKRDAAIPGAAGSATFGVLVMAQALGDREALIEAGRRVLRVHLDGQASSGLKRLTSAVDAALSGPAGSVPSLATS